MFEQKPNLFYHDCDAIKYNSSKLIVYNKKDALNQLKLF